MLMLELAVVPPDLEGFIFEKLAHAVGEDEAAGVLASAKRVAGVEHIATTAQVVAVGKVLATQGGFAGIVGDLVVLEASRWTTM